jgi:hypothetical protein
MALGLVPKAKEVTNPNGNRDKFVFLYCVAVRYIVCFYSCFCFFFSGALNDVCWTLVHFIVGFILPTLHSCTYAIHFIFLTRRGRVNFDRRSR